jgi:hypothetical protein
LSYQLEIYHVHLLLGLSVVEWVEEMMVNQAYLISVSFIHLFFLIMVFIDLLFILIVFLFMAFIPIIYLFIIPNFLFLLVKSFHSIIAIDFISRAFLLPPFQPLLFTLQVFFQPISFPIQPSSPPPPFSSVLIQLWLFPQRVSPIYPFSSFKRHSSFQDPSSYPPRASFSSPLH